MYCHIFDIFSFDFEWSQGDGIFGDVQLDILYKMDEMDGINQVKFHFN